MVRNYTTNNTDVIKNLEDFSDEKKGCTMGVTMMLCLASFFIGTICITGHVVDGYSYIAAITTTMSKDFLGEAEKLLEQGVQSSKSQAYCGNWTSTTPKRSYVQRTAARGMLEVVYNFL